jgi:hypothetical protein
MKTCVVVEKNMLCRDHRLHKARTQPIHISGHTEAPEPPQLASGITIEPTGRVSFVTKGLTMTMATLADSGSAMASQVPVGATTDFVLTGV